MIMAAIPSLIIHDPSLIAEPASESLGLRLLGESRIAMTALNVLITSKLLLITTDYY